MVEKRIRKINGNGLNDTIEMIKKVIYGTREYSPSAKQFLVKYYNNTITGIIIRRSPLSNWIKKSLSVLTWGDYDQKMKNEQPQEDLYHISMVVILDNGVKLLVEKTETVIIMNFRNLRENEEELVVNVNNNISFGDFFQKTIETYGAKKIFLYRVKTSNCGNFVEYLLKSNHLYNDDIHKFIFQDVQNLLKGHRNIEKLVNTTTDLQGRLNVLAQGGELKPKSKSKSKWIEYVKQVQKSKNITYKEALIVASKTYKK